MEFMMPSSNEKQSLYLRVVARVEKVGGYSVELAETPVMKEAGVNREHRRLIGLIHPKLNGRPIVYSDTIRATKIDEVYVYARHRVDKVSFFSKLDLFLSKTLLGFAELSGKSFDCVMQMDGELQETEIDLPIAKYLEARLDGLTFFRLSTVFGDISVEFVDKPIIRTDELAFTAHGSLNRATESPLFGFDGSKSDVWVPFMAEIHWASNLITSQTLETMIQTAIQVPA
jgi:hypothetical protein